MNSLSFGRVKFMCVYGGVMSECGQPGMEIRGQLLGAGFSLSP